MGKLIASINTTPDGFCGHTSVVADDACHQFASDLLRLSGTVLFGRVTYQLFESYWPAAAKNNTTPEPMLAFARSIDAIDKIVFSTTLTEVKWNHTTLLGDIDLEAITKIKKTSGKDLLIFGSPSLVSELTAFGMIDTFYFSIQPLMPGNGKRLFESAGLDKKCNLRLKDAKTFPSGVVVLCYQPVGKVLPVTLKGPNHTGPESNKHVK
jgi:dihydrofolate reductase